MRKFGNFSCPIAMHTQFTGEQTDDAKSSAATGIEDDSVLGPVDLTRISEIETHDSEKIGKVHHLSF